MASDLLPSRSTPEHDSFLQLVRSADYIAAHTNADGFEQCVPNASCTIERISTVTADVASCLVCFCVATDVRTRYYRLQFPSLPKTSIRSEVKKFVVN